MAKNQSSDPATDPKPKSEPKIELKVKTDLKVDISKNTFTLFIECGIYSDGKGVSGQVVFIKDGVSTKQSATTDAHGIAIVSITEPLPKTEVVKNLRCCLAGFPKEELVNITIPAKAERSFTDNDPESLILSRYHDGNGKFKVHIRVLKQHGIGLKTKVNVWYKGQNQDIDTDKHGNAVYEVPGTLCPGDSYLFTASVSGIHNVAKLKIKRAKDPKHCTPSFTKDWYLGTNNGRAFILICAVAFFWLLVVVAGPGEPLINKMTFRDDASGLSAQEQIYNDIVSKVDQRQMIKKQEHDSRWQHELLKFSILLTLFTLIYAPLSLREEVMAGVEEGLEKIMDKNDGQSNDPLFEKLGKLVGLYSVARNKKATVKVVNESTGQESSSHLSHPDIGTLFSLDLLSDTLVQVVPAILKKIF